MMTDATVRLVIAGLAFAALVAGVAMLSVPWALIVGGSLVLGATVAGTVIFYRRR